MKPNNNRTTRTAKTTKSNKPKSLDDYLARVVSDDKRAALENLRKTIRAAAPEAVECISYDLPAFCLNGKFLVACGAAAKHCAFYVGSTVQAFNDELKDYDGANGAAETQGCTDVAGRDNKKSKKYVFSRRKENARTAGFAPYTMIDGVGLGPVVIAGIKLLVIDHQLAVQKMQLFHSGVAVTRIVGSRRKPYQHADAVFLRIGRE
jgi:uncharacterized protein YdhG (YjbR/CyaY superfamily)